MSDVQIDFTDLQILESAFLTMKKCEIEDVTMIPMKKSLVFKAQTSSMSCIATLILKSFDKYMWSETFDTDGKPTYIILEMKGFYQKIKNIRSSTGGSANKKTPIVTSLSIQKNADEIKFKVFNPETDAPDLHTLKMMDDVNKISDFDENISDLYLCIVKLKTARFCKFFEAKGNSPDITILIHRDRIELSTHSDVDSSAYVWKTISSKEKDLYLTIDFLDKKSKTSSDLNIDTPHTADTTDVDEEKPLKYKFARKYLADICCPQLSEFVELRFLDIGLQIWYNLKDRPKNGSFSVIVPSKVINDNDSDLI